MGELAPSHWLVVLVVLVLLFGSTKLPEIARSLGRSARILKAEARGLHADEQEAQQPRSADGREQQRVGEAGGGSPSTT